MGTQSEIYTEFVIGRDWDMIDGNPGFIYTGEFI